MQLPGMMPGSPPGMTPGMPGAMPPSMPGQGGPGPEMAALTRLAGLKLPQRGEKAAMEAAALIQVAASEAAGRSAKAAEHFSRAYSEVMKGRQVLQELATAPVGPQPNLLGGMLPSPAGMPGGPTP